jgi:hypothetical protein
LNVKACVLTSAEGKQLAGEKDAERAAKAQKKKEADLRRKAQEMERQQRRIQHPDQPFTGSLTSKNKSDLQEIAAAIELSEDGTKNVLIARINAFFNTNPSLRNTARFVGLFNRISKCRPQVTENPPTSAPTSPNQSSTAWIPLATNIANLNTTPSSSSHYYTTSCENHYTHLPLNTNA